MPDGPVSLGRLLIHEFETAFPKRDRTGLELRKSNAINVLRFLGRESIVTKRVALGEPFRIGSKLSQSGKHKKPRRESRLFSFKSRVFWGFLLTAAPSCSSLPARSTFRLARFLIPTPSRIAESLGLSRLTVARWLTELGR